LCASWLWAPCWFVRLWLCPNTPLHHNSTECTQSGMFAMYATLCW
jgi:hypothetical protein